MAEPGPPVAAAAGGPSLLQRRWKAVLVGVLLGLLAGQLFTVLSTPRYSSTTAVLVLPTRTTTAGAVGGAPSDVNMNTESELVRSAQVVRGAAASLGGGATLQQVLERLDVTVPPNSQVLSISYVDRTAQAAQLGARAVAQAYLSSRQADVQADVERLSGTLRRDLEFAEEQLRLATDQAASLPANSPDRVYAEAQRDILGSQITNLNGRLTTLTASTDRAGVIITDAVLPSRASFPVPALDLAAGLVLGLLLGAVLALLADRLDHRLRRGSDVERRVGLPVLADLVAAGGSPRSGRFDRLRNALDGRRRTPAPVQVTAAAGSRASSAVALELASSWGRVNGATTLVLAHEASSTVDALDLADRAGLAELLRGESGPVQVLHDHPAHPGVLVVPPGRQAEQLETLLQSATAPEALAALGRSASVVVLETAGTDESAAAQALARSSSTVVLAVERGGDERGVARAARSVAELGGDLAGVVLVPRVRTRRASRRRSGRSATTAGLPGPPPAPAHLDAAPVPPRTGTDGGGWADVGAGDPRDAEPPAAAPATGGAPRPPR